MRPWAPWHVEHVPARDNGRSWLVCDFWDDTICDYETQAEAEADVDSHNRSQAGRDFYQRNAPP